MNACTILGSKSKLSMHCQECVSHLYVTWAWLPKSHAGGYDGRLGSIVYIDVASKNSDRCIKYLMQAK